MEALPWLPLAAMGGAVLAANATYSAPGVSATPNATVHGIDASAVGISVMSPAEGSVGAVGGVMERVSALVSAVQVPATPHRPPARYTEYPIADDSVHIAPSYDHATQSVTPLQFATHWPYELIEY